MNQGQVLRGLRRAAHAIDYGEGVVRHDIAAPRHMAVRAHQHQAPFVELAYAGIGDRDVMKCMAEATRRFAVDPDRVYLTGTAH